MYRVLKKKLVKRYNSRILAEQKFIFPYHYKKQNIKMNLSVGDYTGAWVEADD